MNVYEPLVTNGYEWVNCANGEDYDVFNSFDGTARRKEWRPVLVRRVRADNAQDMKESDFPWLGSWALVMRKAAVDALRDILENNGEILPLQTDDGIELFVFNAQTIDALDESKSNIMRLPNTNRIMLVKSPVFFENAIKDLDLFRLPHRASSTYVSDQFVKRVKEAGLRGLTYNKVWSSGEGL
ncbi:MAG: hypothetical protein J0M09_01210 [Xanthomonadales bacterium]|nr:hypothetical protein [Xanthomonadales bacterium]